MKLAHRPVDIFQVFGETSQVLVHRLPSGQQRRLLLSLDWLA